MQSKHTENSSIQCTEAANRRCAVKKVFLKIAQQSQEKHQFWSLFLIKLQFFKPPGIFLWILRNF